MKRVDSTQLIATLGTAVAGIGAGASLVWRFMVRQVDAKDAEIQRLNEARIASAERYAQQMTTTANQYAAALNNSTDVIEALTVTFDARSK